MAASPQQNGTRKQSGQTRRTSGSTNSTRSRSTSSNSASSRTRTEASRGNSTRNTRSKQNEVSVMDEIVLILIFALVIFLFLCTVGIIGSPKGSETQNFGDWIQAFMLGLFGYTAYIAPIVAFVSIALGIANRNNTFVWFKIGSLIALVLVIGVLMHMISYHDLEVFKTAKDWPKTFYQDGKGGGVIFGAVTLLLYSVIGKVGMVFFLLVLSIIALVLLTGKSFIKGVKKGSKKIYETTREESGHIKEISAKIREDARNAYFEDDLEEVDAEEEELLPRRHRKVRGVTTNTTLKPMRKEEKDSSDDIKEIKAEEKILDIEEPVRKETSDIHQIQYEEKEDEDDWIRPVSVRSCVNTTANEEDDMIKPIRRKQEEPEPMVAAPVTVSPVVSEASKTDDAQTENIVKPVAHLRSRDKSEMTHVLTGSVKDELHPKEKKEYRFPPVSLLTKGESKKGQNDSDDLAATARRLEETLETFGVRVKVTDYSKGPAVTRYELHPEQGVKVSRILSLADDIKLNLAASDIRIEAPIPGKMAVGIEVPNKSSSAVPLRDMIDNNEFKAFPSNLAFAVGKDIGGQLIITDIAKMPHVLIAGATGSGKSVCINTLIMSILFKAHPDDVKMIMIDPKVVELNVYNGIPHLMIPVVTDPKKASAALAWGVAEMTERYKKFADAGVRDLKGYNQKAERGETDEEGAPLKKMPQIIIIVDELADLMMVASKEVEESICRLAQLARAAGIHLIIATQRPSVDVITGLIKANMPSRIAFSVSSGIDSRTILDANGAEKLLGKGDMLFFPQGYSKPARVQGAFVSDKEVLDVVDFIKNQSISNDYGERMEEAILSSSASGGSSISGEQDEYDTYFAEAGRFVIEKEKGSIGMLQRVFKIGFNRAARIMDQLEEAGVVGPEEGTKPRRILMSISEFEHYLEER